MHTALTTLFGRDFLVGYFLPAAAVLGAAIALLMGFGEMAGLIAGVKQLVIELSGPLAKPLPGRAPEAVSLTNAAIAAALLAWLIAVILLALNTRIYKILEGYGALNPLRVFIFWQRWKYRRLTDQVDALWDQADAELDALKKARMDEKLARLKFRLTAHFPDKEAYVLATAFGNTIRAFEVYPRVMYGIEAIQGWPRLLAVMSKDYLAQIETAKAEVDFWMNLIVACCLTITGYAALSWRLHGFDVWRWPLIWVPLLASLLAIVFSRRARDAASEWGELVKAAFDVYLSDLRKKLEFEDFDDADNERLRWQSFSQAMLYRLPEQLVNRKTEKEDKDKPKQSVRVFGFVSLK